MIGGIGTTFYLCLDRDLNVAMLTNSDRMRERFWMAMDERLRLIFGGA